MRPNLVARVFMVPDRGAVDFSLGGSIASDSLLMVRDEVTWFVLNLPHKRCKWRPWWREI